MSAIPQFSGALQRRPKATPVFFFFIFLFSQLGGEALRWRLMSHQSRQSTIATYAAVASTACNTTTKVSRDLEQLVSRLVCCCGPMATLVVSAAQVRRELLGVVFFKLAFLIPSKVHFQRWVNGILLVELAEVEGLPLCWFLT
jgi:hypothetical protein